MQASATCTFWLPCTMLTYFCYTHRACNGYLCEFVLTSYQRPRAAVITCPVSMTSFIQSKYVDRDRINLAPLYNVHASHERNSSTTTHITYQCWSTVTVYVPFVQYNPLCKVAHTTSD